MAPLPKGVLAGVEYRTMFFDRVPLAMKADAFESDQSLLRSNFRFGTMTVPMPRRVSFWNYRTGTSDWVDETELTTDLVADYLPQDAGALAAYFALTDNAVPPVEALRNVLSTWTSGP